MSAAALCQIFCDFHLNEVNGRIKQLCVYVDDCISLHYLNPQKVAEQIRLIFQMTSQTSLLLLDFKLMGRFGSMPTKTTPLCSLFYTEHLRSDASCRRHGDGGQSHAGGCAGADG